MSKSDAKFLTALEQLVSEPKMGIKKDEGDAVVQLLRYALTGEAMSAPVERRWREVGRLSKSGQVRISSAFNEHLEVEVVLMGLEYSGLVERVSTDGNN